MMFYSFQGSGLKIKAATPLTSSKLKWAWRAQFLSYAFEILGKFLFFEDLQMIVKSLLAKSNRKIFGKNRGKQVSRYIRNLWLRLHSILVHQSPILSTVWNPKSEKLSSLLILTTDGLLHVWTRKGALCLSLPPLDQDYGKIKSVQWNPLGKALALTCQDGIVCCRVGKKN